MWKAPADLPRFSEQDAVIAMFKPYADLLWDWSWIAPNHMRADSLDLWREVVASVHDHPDYVLKLAKAQVQELEWRATHPDGGPPPKTTAEKLRDSAIHRAAKMALMVRDILFRWYREERPDEIRMRANKIVASLWNDGGVREMAMAEAKEDGLVMIDPAGWEVTSKKLNNYLRRTIGDPRRLV